MILMRCLNVTDIGLGEMSKHLKNLKAFYVDLKRFFPRGLDEFLPTFLAVQ